MKNLLLILLLPSILSLSNCMMKLSHKFVANLPYGLALLKSNDFEGYHEIGERLDSTGDSGFIFISPKLPIRLEGYELNYEELIAVGFNDYELFIKVKDSSDTIYFVKVTNTTGGLGSDAFLQFHLIGDSVYRNEVINWKNIEEFNGNESD